MPLTVAIKVYVNCVLRFTSDKLQPDCYHSDDDDDDDDDDDYADDDDNEDEDDDDDDDDNDDDDDTHLNSTTMFSPVECGTTWSVCGRGLNANRSL